MRVSTNLAQARPLVVRMISSIGMRPLVDATADTEPRRSRPKYQPMRQAMHTFC